MAPALVHNGIDANVQGWTRLHSYKTAETEMEPVSAYVRVVC